MKKRLRKKLHRGEFQELGFAVTWQFIDPLDAEELDTLFHALLALVEGRGLTFGGGGDLKQGSGFLCKKGRGSVAEEDSTRMVEWFEALGPTVSATVGPHEDAWHTRAEFTIVRDWIARDAPVIILPA